MKVKHQDDCSKVKSLEEFGGRLQRAKDARQSELVGTAKRNENASALRLVTEMVSSLLVGGAIGWFVDQWLNTQPWMLLVFLLLGAITGILSAYRAAMNFSPEIDV